MTVVPAVREAIAAAAAPTIEGGILPLVAAVAVGARREDLGAMVATVLLVESLTVNIKRAMVACAIHVPLRLGGGHQTPLGPPPVRDQTLAMDVAAIDPGRGLKIAAARLVTASTTTHALCLETVTITDPTRALVTEATVAGATAPHQNQQLLQEPINPPSPIQPFHRHHPFTLPRRRRTQTFHLRTSSFRIFNLHPA
jgi:hypothetical protein